MDTSEFREFSKAATDYIINYHENIRSRQVSSSVEPGYLFSKLPKEVPNKPEKWQTILEDMENVIMPGITHWQSPSFHGYFPTSMSYPSIVGELMSAGIGIMGFNWSASPVCTELEILMMDWLCRMMNLPPEFLNSSEGPGGGMLQSTASEATLLGLIVAKDKTVRQIKNQFPDLDEGSIKSKLVAYTSEHSNSSVEKSAIVGSMMIRLLPTDSEGRLHGDTLKEAVEDDIEKGLIPCYVVATLGTTGTCAFDLLREIGRVCKLHSLWLHVDAAYAGAAFVCPEYQYLTDGVEYADSLVINLHKWLLVAFDCSAMWMKNRNDVYNALTIDRVYLENCENHYLDLRNFQLPLGRRFRSLKVWFTLRLYGLSGLQEHIRKFVALAKYFERIAREDERFEIVVPAVMGLVCFRLKGKNSLSQLLLDKILKSRQIFIVPATLKDVFVLRFVITNPMTNADDIKKDWNFIQDLASTIITNDNKNVYKTAENDLPKLTGLCKKEILHGKCQKYSQA